MPAISPDALKLAAAVKAQRQAAKPPAALLRPLPLPVKALMRCGEPSPQAAAAVARQKAAAPDPATLATMHAECVALREQVATLTADRDRLAQANAVLVRRNAELGQVAHGQAQNASAARMAAGALLDVAARPRKKPGPAPTRTDAEAAKHRARQARYAAKKAGKA